VTKKIAILGAGISGLSFAHYLKKRNPDLDITVFEKETTLGGNMISENHHGDLVEWGPRAIRPVGKGRVFLEMVFDLSLQDKLIAANSAAKGRFISVDKKLQALPKHPLQIFTSPLLKGWFSVLRKELIFKPLSRNQDVSVYDFFKDHVGEDFVNRIIDPGFSGIYAGNIKRMSAKAVVPKLMGFEEAKGSFIKGFFGQKKASNEVPGDFQGWDRHPMVSLQGGLNTVIQEIVKVHGVTVKSNCQISHIDEQKGEIISNGESNVFNHIISTIPSNALAQITQNVALNSTLLEIEYTKLAAVNLTFPKGTGFPKGFGFLVPTKENTPLLGCLFNHFIFPDFSPSGQPSLTLMLGGANNPELLNKTDQEITDIGLQAIKERVGDLPQPSRSLIKRWENAIPHYTLGHLDRVEKIEKITRNTKLTVGGNFLKGVAVTDCILNARRWVDANWKSFN
jgi:oxygen-dependent protoporphyrinogen oxidase